MARLTPTETYARYCRDLLHFFFFLFSLALAQMWAPRATQYKLRFSKVLRRASFSAAILKAAMATVAAVGEALGERYCQVRHAWHGALCRVLAYTWTVLAGRKARLPSSESYVRYCRDLLHFGYF